MRKLGPNDNRGYNDLPGNDIEMRLSIADGFIFVDTRKDRFKINDTKLRIDGVPRELMEYLINVSPGKTMKIEKLRHEAKIAVPNDLKRLVIRIGFTGSLRCLFVPICKKDEICVTPSIQIPKEHFTLILDEFKNKLLHNLVQLLLQKNNSFRLVQIH